MPLPPILLNTIAIRDAPLHDKITLARKHGFAGLEMWTDDAAPQLMTSADRQSSLERYGWVTGSDDVPAATLSGMIENASLHLDGIIPGGDIMGRWGEDLDKGLIESLSDTFRMCEALNCRYLVLPMLARHGTLSVLAGNLREIAPLAVRHGIRLGLEPIGHMNLGSRVKDALEVLEIAGIGSTAGVVLDAFHFFRAGQELTDLAPVEKEQILAVQINDAISMPVESLLGNRHRDFPGAGMFDVSGFCEAVLARGYDGAFAVEIMNPSIWAQPPDDVCRRAFSASHEILSDVMGEIVNS